MEKIEGNFQKNSLVTFFLRSHLNDCNLAENFSELKFLFIIMHANQNSKGTSHSNMHRSDSY